MEDENGNVIWDWADDIYAQQFDMYIASSRDDVNWDLYSRLPVYTARSNTGHSALKAPCNGRYVAFGRFRSAQKCPDFDICRNAARVHSDDSIDWSDPELFLG